jgi:Eukaryotic aspartyl protease
MASLFQNVLDIGTVQLGTPPKDFRLLIDSGSADLWVGAEGCIADDGSGSCVSPIIWSNGTVSNFLLSTNVGEPQLPWAPF